MRTRVIVMLSAHLVMILVCRWMLNLYEPDPNGFRLNDLGNVAGWALIAGLPVLISLLARRWSGLIVCAVVQALSPLALLPTAADPSSDLNFAAFHWWFVVPAVVGLVVFIDNRWPRLGERPGDGSRS